MTSNAPLPSWPPTIEILREVVTDAVRQAVRQTAVGGALPYIAPERVVASVEHAPDALKRPGLLSPRAQKSLPGSSGRGGGGDDGGGEGGVNGRGDGSGGASGERLRGLPMLPLAGPPGSAGLRHPPYRHRDEDREIRAPPPPLAPTDRMVQRREQLSAAGAYVGVRERAWAASGGYADATDEHESDNYEDEDNWQNMDEVGRREVVEVEKDEEIQQALAEREDDHS